MRTLLLWSKETLSLRMNHLRNECIRGGMVQVHQNNPHVIYDSLHLSKGLDWRSGI
jgi:hypothetical protein